MRVLVACEESQAVTIEMRKLGHEAYSCDIIECSGGHPEWHIMQDVLPMLNGNCSFKTTDGTEHSIEGKWDMIIAFPPCTYLTVTGNRWFNVERYGEKAIQRQKDREEAIKFFMAFANADCPRIAIENPIGVMSTAYRKPNQIIHPWMFALSEEEKNDSSFLKNHTNVKNSEWAILFTILGQALVDWCVENGKQENLWSFSIKVKRVVDGVEDLYIPSFNVKYYDTDNQVVKRLEDKSKREGFVGCQDFLLGLVSEFLEMNKRDLPLDWNMFYFGLDALETSCEYGEWLPVSDGHMNLASVDEKNNECEIYLECM